MTSVQTKLGEMVAKANTKVLPDLQNATKNPLTYQTIEGINYLYGHMLEVSNTIQLWLKDETLKKKRFPLVALIEDKSDMPQGAFNGYGKCRLNVIICMATKQNWTSLEREANTFVPILRPIYKELMQQIMDDGYFVVYSDADMQHQAYDRKFWGTEDETKNRLTEYVDAIDIKNLELKYFRTDC